MQEIRIDQIAVLSLGAITDVAGNPASVEGDPVWASTDDGLMTVEADVDEPMKARCTPANSAAGQTVNITATLDADLGEGVRQVIGVLTFAILGGLASFVELTVESLEDKPAA